MMIDLFLPYKLAKLAKAKGFKDYFKFGSVTSLYDKKGNHVQYMNYGFMYSGLDEGYISAPIYPQIVDWLEDEFGIYICRELTSDGYRYGVYKNDKWLHSCSYQEQAIEEAFKLI